MIKIDKHNVEAYYLDHLEGNLSVEDTKALFLFIEDHPELAHLFEDLDGILDLKLEPYDIHFGDTEDIKTLPCQDDDICLSNIDDWLVAKFEKTLSPEKEKAVNDFVKLHGLELNEAYVNAAQLKPNLSEVFGETEDLKILPQDDDEMTLSNIDYWLIAKSEHTLSPEKVIEVDEFVKLNGLEKEEAYIGAALLKPDLSETFGDTSILKKEEGGKIIPLLFRVVSVAAIFIFLWLVINPSQPADQAYATRTIDVETKPEPIYESQSIINNTTKKNLASSIDDVSENKAYQVNSSNQKDKSSSYEKTVNLFKQEFVSLKPKQILNYPPKEIHEDINMSNLFSDFEETIARNKKIQNDGFMDDNLAAVEGRKTAPQSQLNEQYRPITRRLSNFTQLDMSYKKSPETADISQTVIQIGKFSFERKIKK